MRQPCREWKVAGACTFGARCKFLHSGAAVACLADFTSEQCKVEVTSVSQPLITSASGSLIHLAPLDVHKWSALLSEHKVDFRVEFYKRLLLALLQPMFPHLAAEVASSFNTRECSYIFDDLTSWDLDVFEQSVRPRLARIISVRAAQDAGFARLARMCYIECNGPSLQNAPFGQADACSRTAEYWSCAFCAFVNESTGEQKKCSSCASSLQYLKHHLHFAAKARVPPSASSELQPEQAMKAMRKLEKKLNQVTRVQNGTSIAF